MNPPTFTFKSLFLLQTKLVAGKSRQRRDFPAGHGLKFNRFYNNLAKSVGG